MSLSVNVIDKGTNRFAIVTNRGQLVTSALDFSESVFHSLIVDNTADTWFKPQAGKRLVVTDVIVQTDRNTAVAGTVIDIYEASSENSGTIDKSIFQFDLERQAQITLIGLNLIITEGKFLNAKATDSNVLITICGYFVDA